MEGLKRKFVISGICVMVGLLAYFSVFDLVLRPIDRNSQDYLDKVFIRSAATFAIARTINGAISVIQGTDITISPMGIGTKLAIGEILDPVNDLIEQFSSVMLAATGSLGIQKVMVRIGPWLGFQVVLLIALALIVSGTWITIKRFNLVNAGQQLIILAIIIRLTLPLVALFSENIYDLFLHDQYTQSMASLEESKKKLSEAAKSFEDTDPVEDSSFIDRWVKKGKDLINLNDRLGRIKEAVANHAEHIVDLIVVFIIQTMIIPLLVIGFLWLVVKQTLASLTSPAITLTCDCAHCPIANSPPPVSPTLLE